MKKKLVVLFMVFALVLSMMSILAVQAAEDGAEVKVVVNKDGTITVTATGTFDEKDWVGIYKQGEMYDPNMGGEKSLVWWYLKAYRKSNDSSNCCSYCESNSYGKSNCRSECRYE